MFLYSHILHVCVIPTLESTDSMIFRLKTKCMYGQMTSKICGLCLITILSSLMLGPKTSKKRKINQRIPDKQVN